MRIFVVFRTDAVVADLESAALTRFCLADLDVTVEEPVKATQVRTLAAIKQLVLERLDYPNMHATSNKTRLIV